MKDNIVGINVERKGTVQNFVVKMDTVARKTRQKMAAMD